MKLSGYLEAYKEFSGKASDVARQLAFVGVAIIWIFKVEGPQGLMLPKQLLFPSILLVSGLAADLLQYMVATFIWDRFHRYHEKKLKEEGDAPELVAPRCLILPILIFFWLKLFLVIFAYVFLFIYIWGKWVVS